MSAGKIAYEDWSKRDVSGAGHADVIASSLGMTVSFEPIDG